MDRIVQPYNPLEDKGVSVDQGNAAKFSFVAEHVTEGKQSLKAEFTAEAIAAGKAVIKIGVTEGGDLHASYKNQWRTPSYWCHYRWLKVDLFNPAPAQVRVRVANVPFILRPGSNVVAVKTADTAGHAVAFTQPVSAFSVQVTAPGRDATLFIDNARLEQEVPAVIAKEGRLFQFPAHDGPNTAPLLWPGLTAAEASTVYAPERAFGWVGPPKCAYSASSFRSEDNGILWGACSGIETPFRADVPDGRYGICVIATPGSGFQWPKGATIRVGGKDYSLFTARADEEARRARLSGELWDFRPGTCIWEELVRPPFYPRTEMVFAEAVNGHLLLEFPRTIEVRAVFVFPEKSREEALKELGRFNYLMAESWDVSHAWVKGDVAERARYIGFHEEASRPDAVAQAPSALDRGGGLEARLAAVSAGTCGIGLPRHRAVRGRGIRGFDAEGLRVARSEGMHDSRHTSACRNPRAAGQHRRVAREGWRGSPRCERRPSLRLVPSQVHGIRAPQPRLQLPGARPGQTPNVEPLSRCGSQGLRGHCRPRGCKAGRISRRSRDPRCNAPTGGGGADRARSSSDRPADAAGSLRNRRNKSEIA